jgi:hypothetical protein
MTRTPTKECRECELERTGVEEVHRPIIATKLLQGLAVHYRPGTSDERVLEEVVAKATMRGDRR